jgi:hypothetical protein
MIELLLYYFSPAYRRREAARLAAIEAAWLEYGMVCERMRWRHMP